MIKVQKVETVGFQTMLFLCYRSCSGKMTSFGMGMRSNIRYKSIAVAEFVFVPVVPAKKVVAIIYVCLFHCIYGQVGEQWFMLIMLKHFVYLFIVCSSTVDECFLVYTYMCAYTQVLARLNSKSNAAGWVPTSVSRTAQQFSHPRPPHAPHTPLTSHTAQLKTPT